MGARNYKSEHDITWIQADHVDLDITITVTADGGVTKTEDHRINQMLDEIEKKAGPR